MYELKDILKDEQTLKKIIFQALFELQGKVDDSHICIQKTYNNIITVRNGLTEYIEFSDDIFFSITVYLNHRKGTVTSTDISIKSLKRTINSAIEIAKLTSPDYNSGLPKFNLFSYEALDLDLFHLSILDLKDGVKLARLTEKYALNFDKRIINTEGSCFSSSIKITAFGNTKGIVQTYKSSEYSLSVCTISQERHSKKKERDYYYSISRKFNDLKSPKYIGNKCSERALMRLNSHKISTQKLSVIFISDISSEIFDCLAQAIQGDKVYKKSTFLLNSLQKVIFPVWLNIFENPHIKRGLYSAPFDNEGTLTKPRFIVKNGVLQTWLLNSYSARKLNLQNTGHAGGIYNWIFLQKNNIALEFLLQKMNFGLVITDFMGDGFNLVNGDFSRGASGYLIENGTFKHAISEITVSGNLKEIYKNIVCMSNDYDRRKSIQSGSILISEINISGM
ncbi:metalloprotease PmbA [Buchnera aphidicola]|uniref:metalloprotease PmbA n=1 Tax=Buchnera aphidicola TaxID=9 RepID=UPI0020937C5D|nr:metalloprotease PmbA [Buchnera aphidicola]USS94191.1 metalloprotease PmbA [Buchnera aphidicola (Sipha maydis)]